MAGRCECAGSRVEWLHATRVSGVLRQGPHPRTHGRIFPFDIDDLGVEEGRERGLVSVLCGVAQLLLHLPGRHLGVGLVGRVCVCICVCVCVRSGRVTGC